MYSQWGDVCRVLVAVAECPVTSEPCVDGGIACRASYNLEGLTVMYVYTPKIPELCTAATKIQANFRGHMARKQQGKSDDELSKELEKLDAKSLEFERSNAMSAKIPHLSITRHAECILESPHKAPPPPPKEEKELVHANFRCGLRSQMH
ncbi:hypothetical protein B566_EDAN018159 [Ephemera danica]|nr:hypothetical protein B566_EDAN018159 [Ephemera danica]